MTQIIGDKGKRKRYDPDLARKVNEEIEEQRKKGLEDRVKGSERKTEVIDQEKLVRLIKQINDIGVGIICGNYEEYMKIIASKYSTELPPEIELDLKPPSKQQIESFVKILPNYKKLKHFKDYTSFYLSALMNASIHNEFELDFKELNKQGKFLHYVGHNLHGKKLTVEGNVGDMFGMKAKDADLILNGDAKGGVGYMAEDTKIYVKGCAGDSCGQEAKNSEIVIDMSVGHHLGFKAESSIIKVGGLVGTLIGYMAVKSKIYVPYMWTCNNLSDEIGEGTKVYGRKGDKDFLVYPESRWTRFKKWLPKL